jgi:hypothetical protein
VITHSKDSSPGGGTCLDSIGKRERCHFEDEALLDISNSSVAQPSWDVPLACIN